VSDPHHGPLPALLLGLTVVTGLVDAVSILSLGRVFVANMTGNVVFVGFALAGAPGFSLSASLFALGGFVVGAYGAGVLIGRIGSDRGTLLFDSVVIVAQVGSLPYSGPVRDATAALTAIAMGVQNGMARKLAVPDLTTTVLTMTLTGLATELRARNQAALVRRLLAVGTMLGGAIVGAVLVEHVRPSAALEAALGLVAVEAMLCWRATREPATWRAAP
jgi:uncharacterized membrane protein YoaK (UPF0700 family)